MQRSMPEAETVHMYEMTQLNPHQEVQLDASSTHADTLSLRVQLDMDHSQTVDPNSYVDARWEGERLKITNITGSPVYLSVEQSPSRS